MGGCKGSAALTRGAPQLWQDVGATARHAGTGCVGVCDAGAAKRLLPSHVQFIIPVLPMPPMLVLLVSAGSIHYLLACIMYANGKRSAMLHGARLPTCNGMHACNRARSAHVIVARPLPTPRAPRQQDGCGRTATRYTYLLHRYLPVPASSCSEDRMELSIKLGCAIGHDVYIYLYTCTAQLQPLQPAIAHMPRHAEGVRRHSPTPSPYTTACRHQGCGAGSGQDSEGGSTAHAAFVRPCMHACMSPNASRRRHLHSCCAGRPAVRPACSPLLQRPRHAAASLCLPASQCLPPAPPTTNRLPACLLLLHQPPAPPGCGSAVARAPT